MRTPKAKKLPSGNWRIQLQINKQRISITKPTKKECEEEAKKIFAGKIAEKKSVLTVGLAMDRYINSLTKTLSSATIAGYKNIRKNHLKSIMDICLTDLTSEDIQLAIGEEIIEGRSPKSIRNYIALLTSTLKAFRPNFNVNLKLPQKEKKEITIPTEDELVKILRQAKGTRYELPLLLASWLGLRASEIRGLKFSDFQNGSVHIQRAIVQGYDGPAEKLTKTFSGDRWIKVSETIIKLVNEAQEKAKSDYVCPIRQNVLLKAFKRFCNEAGVPEYRVHDLRHFAASEALALNVPDKYSMKRMGHATDNMLKTVYQHTMNEKDEMFSKIIDEKMENLYNKAVSEDASHGNAHDI